MSYVILVDKNDKEIGKEEKVKAHLGEGKLHRAFSVFVFNNKGDLLIQKRSQEKMLWGGCWSNSCCSHPSPGEVILEAGMRRLNEELGFSCDLEHIGSFIYNEKFENIGSENELCHVLKGEYSDEVYPKKEEVDEIKWMSLEDVIKEVKKEPTKFTPWFKMELERFFK